MAAEAGMIQNKDEVDETKKVHLRFAPVSNAQRVQL